MKLSELFAKLEKSSEFKKFHKQHPKAYFCAAFFVFDYENNETKQQLDYYISEEEGIETFLIGEKILRQKAKMIEKEKLNKIDKNEIKVDMDECLDIVKKEAEKQMFKPSKIIVILQRLKESDQLIWNITAFSGFNLLRMHLAMDKKILMNQKNSMLDMMRIEKGGKNKDSANYVG